MPYLRNSIVYHHDFLQNDHFQSYSLKNFTEHVYY